jgi:chromosome segregation ATPase
MNWGLKDTYSAILCNSDGDEYRLQSHKEADSLRRKLNADCDAYEARIAELEGKLANERSRIMAEVPELAQQAMDIEDLRAELAKANRRDEIVSEGRAEAEKRVNVLEVELAAANAAHADVATAYEQVLADLDRSDEELARVKAVLEARERAITEAIRQRDNARHTAEENRVKAANVTEAHNAMARYMNMDGAPVDISALCSELDEVTSERDDLMDEAADLRRRLDEVLALLEPDEKPMRDKLADFNEWSEELEKWSVLKCLHTRAKAITEGKT